MRIGTIKERLLAKCIPVTESGCWLWLENVKTAGYGRIGVNGKKELAHRVSYEAFKGPIPEGLTIDHLCRVPSCINPDHLEPVTMKENILRGMGVSAVNSRKDRCEHGHLFDEANTYLNHAGGRDCRACARVRYTSNKDVVLKRRAAYYRRNAEKVKARMQAFRERKQHGISA